MIRDELVRDADRMEEICCRLASRQDIWQDHMIYWLAVAVLHLLQAALRKGGEA